jgi:rhodanese-related sulfurtransferase
MSRTVNISAIAALALVLLTRDVVAQAGSILQATLAEPNQKTEEVSTEQVRRTLIDGSALIVDTRSHAEYAAGHIPSARVLNGPASAHVAAIEKLVNGDKTKALVLYCNGPYCGASRRLGDQLVTAGFSNVRRYQLGIPIWRALGGPTEIELEGIVRIFKVDQTAVFIDARSAEEFAKGSIPGARNLTLENADATITKLASGAIQDPPLPIDDFNTRIVLLGRDHIQAREMADLFSKRPWHNVSYFPGPFEALATAVRSK